MSQFDINHKKIVLKNKTRRPVKKNKSNIIILLQISWIYYIKKP